jgi:type I restriction enzyme S subunit
MWCRLPIKKALPGDILMTVRAPVGPTNLVAEESCIGRGLSAIRPHPDKLNTRYAIHYFRTIEPEISRMGRGSPFTSITNDDIRAIEIPLPPIQEQKCIADILDKADAIRRKRQEALRLTDDILRSVFIDKFGEPMTNSRNLPMKPLNRFGEIVTGNTPPRVNPANFGGSLEWIKSDNINTPSYYLSPASEHLSEEGTASARRVPANSILVTCIAGSLSCIGNAAIADREVAFREVAFNQQINAIIPKPDVDHRFLFTQLLIAQNHVQNASTKAMKGMISKSAFSAIEFIAPSASEQQNFGAYFDEIGIVRQKAAESLRHAENLFAALQQQAFSGQL